MNHDIRVASRRDVFSCARFGCWVFLRKQGIARQYLGAHVAVNDADCFLSCLYFRCLVLWSLVYAGLTHILCAFHSNIKSARKT